MVSRNCLVRASVLFVVAGLTACSTGPRRQTYWVNPSFGPELQQQRFTLDSTECRALANQLIPEPPPPAAPEPRTGNVTLYTPNGPVFGTYETQPGYQAPNYMAGYERAQREKNRRNYAVACMGNRGWQQHERIVDQ